MASDGLSNQAKYGTCRMCLRVRKASKYLKAVGEVRHGFATGHIWECIDAENCEKQIVYQLNKNISGLKVERIKYAVLVGRFKKYIIVT